MSASENISHVIFDVDGLLLDTERLYARASAELLAEHGKEYDWGVKAKLMGKAPKEVAEEYVRHFQLPITPEEYLVKTRATMEKLLPDCKFLPGALKLLHHFYKVSHIFLCVFKRQYCGCWYCSATGVHCTRYWQWTWLGPAAAASFDLLL